MPVLSKREVKGDVFENKDLAAPTRKGLGQQSWF